MRRSYFLALSSVSAVALGAFPAVAQVASSPVEAQPAIDATEPEAPKGETVNAEGEGVSEGDIVVTGSRIRRDTYNTDSPVDVITRQDTVLAGSRSTAEVLQSSTVTSGTAQINGSYLGFVSEGGPAANTVGLRGLGAARTLVLMNGRRLAPAGVGPQLIAADLNILPTTMVQRIEVLREGASSIYGSDAIAGVINVITDNKIDGLTIDAYTNQPIEHGGGGRNYRLSTVLGKVFSRGHLTGSLEYRETTGLRVRDRDDFRCPTDLFFIDGEPFGQLDPTTGGIRCFPFSFTPIGTAQNYLRGFNIQLDRFGNPRSRGSRTFAYNGPSVNNFFVANNLDLRPLASDRQLDEHVLSPIKTLTAYLNGAYELDALGGAEVYGEALFTRRKSHQDFLGQLSIDPRQIGYELYGRQVGNFPINPFVPQFILDQGFNAARVFIAPPILKTKQKVDFFRSNVGLRGPIGFGNWKYDGNLQWSETKSRASIPYPDTRRLRNSLTVVTAPTGTPTGLTVTALPGQVGAGGVFTCVGNVTNGTYNGGTCVPLNVFDPQVLAGNIPQNAFEYLFADQVGHTKFRQQTASLIVDGSLFELPAGPLGFAAGVELRRDKLNDTPSEASQSRNLYNFSSVGITKGKDRVFELFGELNVPILRDRPFFDELSVSGSARFTDYQSFGSKVTYHVGGQWAPIEEVRFRANYGTSFRAPNLYEQKVAGLSGFFGPGSDPCDNFGRFFEPGDAIYDNCLAELTQVFDGDAQRALAYFATGGPEVRTTGNASGLDAEESRSWGLGVILTAPRRFADLSLAIDYFNVIVKDQVNQLGGEILDRCYESADDFNQENFYCSLIAPRETAQGTLTSFEDPFLNLSEQKVTGIDFSGRYSTGLLNGRVTANVRATRVLKQIFQQLADDEPFDYVGLLGYQGTVGGPKWVGDLDLRFASGPWTLRYGVEYVGKMDTSNDVFDYGIEFDLKARRYFEHAASVQYNWKDIGQFTLGVNNLFNANPATIGGFPDSTGQFPRIGNYFNYSGYDFIGRSMFLNITRTF